jgi:hypothetical protein
MFGFSRFNVKNYINVIKTNVFTFKCLNYIVERCEFFEINLMKIK